MAEAKPKKEKGRETALKKEEKPAARAPEKRPEPKKEAMPEARKEKAPEKKKEAKPRKEKKGEYNPWKVLRFPHLAEKSMNMVELENKLVFVVGIKSTKAQVREAVERGFAVKVDKVNLEITRKGHKKAYIKLAPGYMASDIASRLGMI